MPNPLTPPPPTGIGILDRWLALLWRKLTAAGEILWTQVSKAGSNLTDIETRNHADLQNLNTASYTHLTATNHTDLTDAGDTALHFHSADRARANHTGTQEADTVLVARIGSPTYSTLQHYVNLSQSSGRITGGALSDAGGANLNVAAGTGWLRIADDDVSDLKFFDWTASNGNAIPAGTTRYVGVEYNAGSPQVVIKTTDTWDEDTAFQLGEVSNESGTLHIINNPFWVGDAITNIIQRFTAIQHVARDNTFGGLLLGETGTRNVTVTAGHIWSRLNDFHFNAFDSSAAGTFDRYYRNGVGGFTREAAQTQWPNTQYDDGSGTLVTMTNNRYANVWLYAETDGDVVLLYGQNQYTSASGAEVESPPASVPTRLQSTGLLIGRIIFQKSAAAATTISSAFSTIFNPVAATDHNLLANLQGGVAGEYFHLTSAEYTGTGTGVFVRKTGSAIDPASIGATTPGSGAFTTLSSSGNATLGDAAASDSHTLNGATVISANSASDALRITQAGAGNALVVEDSANPDATPFVIDANGRVLTGTPTSIAGHNGNESSIQIAANVTIPGVAMFRYATAAAAVALYEFARSASATIGAHAIVAASYALGTFRFSGSDGVKFVAGAEIKGECDATPALDSMPGRIIIATTAVGAAATTEAVRIDSAQNVGIGTQAAPARRLHVRENNSTTNAVTHVQRLTHTAGTAPSAGIGVGVEFEVETSNNNNEVGATIEAVTTDVTAGSEDFDVVVKTMTAGAAAAEAARFNTLAAIFPGSVKSASSTAGIGYATGAGGTVTQATSKATGVTLNKVCGQITTAADALSANTRTFFTLTNSSIAATDLIHVHRVSGGTANSYRIEIDSVASGSCVIAITNITAGSLSEAVVIGFSILKGVTA